jgi:hypothetical protein
MTLELYLPEVAKGQLFNRFILEIKDSNWKTIDTLSISAFSLKNFKWAP